MVWRVHSMSKPVQYLSFLSIYKRSPGRVALTSLALNTSCSKMVSGFWVFKATLQNVFSKHKRHMRTCNRFDVLSVYVFWKEAYIRAFRNTICPLPRVQVRPLKLQNECMVTIQPCLRRCTSCLNNCTLSGIEFSALGALYKQKHKRA